MANEKQSLREKQKIAVMATVAAIRVGNKENDRAFIRKVLDGQARGLTGAKATPAMLSQCLDMLTPTQKLGAELESKGAEKNKNWPLESVEKWTYSDAYFKYLIDDQSFTPMVVDTIKKDTLAILGSMPNPKAEGEFQGRGLVMGHVQSGKTANYLALIARAADAGYRLIIVLAGVYENLRQQTQARCDEGFVGENANQTIGVGKTDNYPYPMPITNVSEDGDFDQKKCVAFTPATLPQDDRPVILVVKKNGYTLAALYRWLKRLKERKTSLAHLPLLMIDDEADNATINTNKKGRNPTRINHLINAILGLCPRASYVAYTATPFANIFIDPELARHGKEGFKPRDLFPRDFIYLLEAPSNYFGPGKVFLNKEISKRTLRAIIDADDILPLTYRGDDLVIEKLPWSLKKAFLTFLLVRAIRNLRDASGQPASMMVNVSPFPHVQRQVRSKLEEYKEKLVEGLGKGAEQDSPIVDEGGRILMNLQNILEKEYPDFSDLWVDIRRMLPGIIEGLDFYTINGESDDRLDYTPKEDGSGRTAVAVGGYSLSRGLTLEGLTVSYLYRNTKIYDTLLQMGRWFGYRAGYEKLCRVWLSEDSIKWYKSIAKATENLMKQFRKMAKAGQSPMEFGFYVLTATDPEIILLVTARNKWGTAEIMETMEGFGYDVVETNVLPADPGINAENALVIKKHWKNWAENNILRKIDGGLFGEIPLGEVSNFLNEFKVYPDLDDIKLEMGEYLAEIQGKWPMADVLLVSPQRAEHDFAKYELGVQKRNESVERDGDAWRMKKGRRMSSRNVEKGGLTDTQIDEARRNAEALHRKGNEPIDADFRKVRNKPLLMLHVLDLSKAEGGGIEFERVPAFGLSFPPTPRVRRVIGLMNEIFRLRGQIGVDDVNEIDD